MEIPFYCRYFVVTLVFLWTTSCFLPANAFQAGLGLSLGTNPQKGWLTKTQQFAVRGDADSGMGDEELTSTLALLDKQWQIQQRKRGSMSRWKKIVLDRVEEDTTSGTKQEEEFVYLLEPEMSLPSCVIFFVGGAGLGQFPHIAYSEFLERVSSRLNAAVLAAPYQIGLDHFTLAKKSGELLRQGLIQCEEDTAIQLRPDLKKYCLAHSLGAKLQTIHMAATGQSYDGVGFLSFNNFGFAQTISMARSFAQQLRSSFGANDATIEDFQNGQEDILNTVFNFAESIIGAIGVEFSPSPSDTERIIELKYDSKRTRLFVSDDDTLDSSQSFYDVCSRTSNGESAPSVSALPGTHLTPVYFNFRLDDLDLPEESREMAAGAVGDFKSASFGDEECLNLLVDEVCGWITGKDPSREPSWSEKDSWQGQRRITAGETGTNSA